jgi:hypothetical protein
VIFPYFTASGTLVQLDSLLRDITHVSAPDGLVILGCVENNIDEEAADQYFVITQSHLNQRQYGSRT